MMSPYIFIDTVQTEAKRFERSKGPKIFFTQKSTTDEIDKIEDQKFDCCE